MWVGEFWWDVTLAGDFDGCVCRLHGLLGGGENVLANQDVDVLNSQHTLLRDDYPGLWNDLLPVFVILVEATQSS